MRRMTAVAIVLAVIFVIGTSDPQADAAKPPAKKTSPASFTEISNLQTLFLAKKVGSLSPTLVSHVCLNKILP